MRTVRDEADAVLEAGGGTASVARLGRETVRGETRGLQMVYDAKMAVRQVAAELHIPEGRVKSRLYHACREVATEWRTLTREWEDLS